VASGASANTKPALSLGRRSWLARLAALWPSKIELKESEKKA
jgi:hypothetical protein